MTDAPLSTPAIAVFIKASGALSYLAPAHLKPTDLTLGWVAIPAGYAEQTFRWDAATRGFVEDAAKVEAKLIDQVKAEGERRRMLAMSTGGSKKSVYPIKAVEVENWNSLGAVGATVQALLLVFNGLNSTVRTRKFRFAIKDAAAHGDTVDKAIARFTAGADTSLNEVARVEGIEQAAVDRIRAATTRQAKLAAFNAINWSAP